MGVPSRIALAVLGSDAGCGAVGSTKYDRAAHLAARHIKGLGGRVDDVVDGLHGEIPGHELDNRFQTGKSGADAYAGKAVFGDRRIDDAPCAKFSNSPWVTL